MTLQKRVLYLTVISMRRVWKLRSFSVARQFTGSKNDTKKRPDWETWFDPLRRNSSVEFIQNERNVIVHEAPPKVGQVLHVGQQVDLAKWCYYYDSPVIPAIDTVRGHVRETARIILEGESMFGTSTVEA